MYEYTIDAYTLDAFGKPHDIIQLVVTANTSDEAMGAAEKIEKRGTYKLVKIRALATQFNTMMGTVQATDKPKLKKG